MGYSAPLGCQKWDFVSALRSIFNCCTAPGKNLSVGTPITLIKERPQAINKDLSQPLT